MVEGIVGIHQWDVTVEGFANHAGTTPMDQRRDALLAAAQFVLAVNRVVRAEPGRQVGTVGRIARSPGAPNVIPGASSSALELRDLTTRDDRDAVRARSRPRRDTIATRHGHALELRARSTRTPPGAHGRAPARDRSTPPRELGLRHGTCRAAPATTRRTWRGLRRWAMIFVPSVGGISHSPEGVHEAGRIANGANVLLRTILKIDAGALE